MKPRTGRRLFAAGFITVVVLVVYVGWGSFTRLLWAPEGSHVILVVDGERHLSYLGNNCYGFGCVDFAGFPVGEKPITVPSGVPFRVDFPDLSPEQWTATVSRVPAYSGLDRRSSLPNLLRPSDALTLVSKWEAASNERATPAAPGWYIVDVNVGWARGQASYIFWLNVAAAPES